MNSRTESYTRTSKLALIALILSVPCLITGPLALFPFALGIVACIRISKSIELEGQAFAFGAIAMGVIGLAGTKVYIDASRRAKFYSAQTMLRAHSQAIVVYMNHDDEHQPPSHGDWPDILIEHGLIDAAYLVTFQDDGDGVAYVYLADFDPSDESSIMMYEDPDHWEEGVIVAFGDAHVEVLSREDFERRLEAQLRTTDP